MFEVDYRAPYCANTPYPLVVYVHQETGSHLQALCDAV